MATPQPFLRKSSHFFVTLRSFATTAKPSHHNDHKRNHKFLEPNSFIGSWEAPKDPKEAEARLAQLRRDYAKQDDARREAIRVANEERKKLKAEVAKVKAEERNIAQEEFRQTLLKERADKLETWSRMMRKHEEKKKEFLHKQSSMSIDESELEKKFSLVVFFAFHPDALNLSPSVSRSPSTVTSQSSLTGCRFCLSPWFFQLLVPTSLPSMATPQPLLRKSSHFSVTLRSFATTAKPSHHNDHKRNHKFLETNSFIGSWEAPKDPKEAEARLAQLRRDYAKQVKERKDDARREAIRVANEERKKLKAEVAKVKAEERKIAQEEFRQTLLKERADKLETWSRMMRKHEEKKKEMKELLNKQSSMWIDESELEKKKYWKLWSIENYFEMTTLQFLNLK
ncbi:hypothetical protein K1719_001390 [Acacia pycnantha]|nr:hypothetical protein K1719_001390 [Acacia pycnantha]